MTVDASGSGPIRLLGECPLEDAEELVRSWLTSPGRSVDFTLCETAHTAVIQVILAVGPEIIGQPADGALSRWINSLRTGADIAAP